uniref:Uncharacterized protein n=1 Tax=Anguilla anguilla TaxID=7936 RepID=A0A0E9R8F4_ANGAN
MSLCFQMEGPLVTQSVSVKRGIRALVSHRSRLRILRRWRDRAVRESAALHVKRRLAQSLPK